MIPPLDSAFATAFGIKSGSVDDLRAEVEANLKLELKRKLDAMLKDQALKGLRQTSQLTLPKSLVEQEALQLARRMAANLQQQGMKPEDIKLSPEMFRPQAEERVALGLILAEIVRDKHLEARPEQVRALVQDVAQTYEQPDAVVRWHFEKPERLNEFEALAVERNVVEWVIGPGQGHRHADDVRSADGSRADLTAASRRSIAVVRRGGLTSAPVGPILVEASMRRRPESSRWPPRSVSHNNRSTRQGMPT